RTRCADPAVRASPGGRRPRARRAGPRRSRTLGGELREDCLHLPEHVGLLVSEVVQIGLERGLDDAKLLVRQLDGVHGANATSTGGGPPGGRPAVECSARWLTGNCAMEFRSIFGQASSPCW